MFIHKQACKDSIDWNMEQLDKYVEGKEMEIEERRKQAIENCVKNNFLNDMDYRVCNIIQQFRIDVYKDQIVEYKTPLKDPIKIVTYSTGHQEIRTHQYYKYHIFEFVYKILKNLFTSNNDIISRLEKLEAENIQLKERLNLLEMKHNE
jgi:hypothetical protein